MLVEVIRFKLKRPLKTRFDKEFKEQLKGPPDAHAAGAVAETVWMLRAAGITYTGQKTHEKQVTTYLEKASAANFSEQQVTDICEALQHLKSVRLFTKYVRTTRYSFRTARRSSWPRRNFYWTRGHTVARRIRCRDCWNRRERWPARCRPTTGRRSCWERIGDLQQQLRSLNPFAALMEGGPFGFFGDMFGGPEDFDEEDDDGFEDWE